MPIEANKGKQEKRSPQEIINEVQVFLENDLPDSARHVAFNDFISLFQRRMDVEATQWRLDELNEKNWLRRQTRQNRKWTHRFSRELHHAELRFTQLDTVIQLEQNRWPAYDEAYRTITASFEQLVQGFNGRPFHVTSSPYLVGDVGGVLEAQDWFDALQMRLRQRINPQKPLR